MATKPRESLRRAGQWAASQFVGKLNGASPDERLRRWVSEWLRVGRDLTQLPKEVQEEINHELGKCIPRLATIHALASQRPLHLTWPPKEGIVFLSRADKHLRAAELVEFIQSPDSSRLEHCARPRCGRYFLREGRRTTYCSPKCAHGHSARRATKQRRQLETRRRLTTARALIEKFGEPWPPNWKDQLRDKVHVTKNWVTRHQNNGDLPKVPTTKSTKRQPWQSSLRRRHGH